MENAPVGAMGPVSGLLALLVVIVAALFTSAVRAWRWRDRRRSWTMGLAGIALSIPVAGLLAVFAHDPQALAWRWPTGFPLEWRCDQNRPQWAPVCLRRAAIPPQRQDGGAAP